jgi:hypothetical protein
MVIFFNVVFDRNLIVFRNMAVLRSGHSKQAGQRYTDLQAQKRPAETVIFQGGGWGSLQRVV